MSFPPFTFPVITLTESQQQWLTAISGSAFGFLASWFLEWYKKKKNPTELESSVMKNANDAANETIMTSQKVIEMLDERLKKEKDWYEELISRSKKECESKIENMKQIYDAVIEDLQAKIIKEGIEKTDLGNQVAALTVDKNLLQKKVFDLENKLNRYENGSSTTTTTTVTNAKAE